MTKIMNERLTQLRKQADAIVSAEPDRLTTKDNEYLNLLHELETYSIELDSQSQELQQTHQQLQQAYDELDDTHQRHYELSPIGYMTLDDNGVIIEANLTIATILGITKDKLLHHKLNNFITHDDQDIFYLFKNKMKQTEKVQRCEIRLKHSSGKLLWLKVDGNIHHQNFQKVYYLSINDISDFKQLENETQHYYKYIESIFRVAPVGIGLVKNRALKEVNDKVCEMTGYTCEELRDKNARILYPSDEDYHYVGEEKYRQIQETGTGSVITSWKCKDGHKIDVVLSSTPLDVNNLDLGVTFTALDITELLQTKRLLQGVNENLVRYKGYFEHAPQPYQALDKHGNLIDTNIAWRKMLGYENSDLGNPWFGQFIISDEREVFDAKFHAVNELDEVHDIECTLQHKDGHPVLVSIDGTIVRDDQGQLIQTQCVLTNITEKRRIDAQLKLFRQQINQSKDAVYVIDYVSSKLLDVNDTACRMLGYSRQELLTKSVIDCSSFFNTQEQWNNVAQKIKNIPNGRILEDEHIDSDGQLVPVEVSAVYQVSHGREILVASVRDISERKLANQQKRQHQESYEHLVNLEIINQTVAAIAHELNQPLNASATYVDAAQHLLKEKSLNLEKINYALEKSSEQIQKAGKVTHELFRFIHSGNSITASLDIEKLISKVIQIVTQDGELLHHRIIYKPSIALPMVCANAIQVEKVLLNIIRNAIMAMNDAGTEEGIISLDAETSSDSVLITIKDNGPGIDTDMQNNLFVPFTTSKKDGLGIGLAISRSMIEAQGGHLLYLPDHKPGATFQLSLLTFTE